MVICVKPVGKGAMAYTTIVINATFHSPQTPLLMPVITIVFTSPSQAIDRSVVFVVLKDTKYSAVPLVNLF